LIDFLKKPLFALQAMTDRVNRLARERLVFIQKAVKFARQAVEAVPRLHPRHDNSLGFAL
jgi:hypothetical protein